MGKSQGLNDFLVGAGLWMQGEARGGAADGVNDPC